MFMPVGKALVSYQGRLISKREAEQLRRAELERQKRRNARLQAQKVKIIPHATKPGFERYDFSYRLPAGTGEPFDFTYRASYLQPVRGRLVCQNCQTNLQGKYVSHGFCPSCGASL